MTSALFSICLACVVHIAHADLTIDNFQPADVVRYPVVIVKGSAEGPEMAIGTSWKTAIRFPVFNHRYSAIVELKTGTNMLLLHSGSESMKFRLDYKPMTGPYRVLAVYVTAADEKDVYYTTNPKDRFPIREKFDVALKLMQAFTADAMQRGGYGRKTFPLEFDKNGRVIVHFVKSPKKGDELRAMDPNAIYSHVYDAIKPLFSEETNKWCGLLGFTSFDPIAKKATGHLALGGGSQALFGAGSMQWWPTTLKEVPKVFADTTVIDHERGFEDSAFRHTVWANVSTALGAALHELGHTFGLPHSPDRFSVMSRGFDYFSRSFTTVEAPGEGKKDSVPFTADQLTHWDPFFAARLNYCPWFQPDANHGSIFAQDSSPTVKLDGDDVIVDAPNGIRVVGSQNDGIPAWFEEHKEVDPPRHLKLSRKELRAKMQDTKLTIQIVVVDARGQVAQIDDSL